MNDDPKIYEANEAMQDRTILIKIKGKNYRRERRLDKAVAEISKRLDEYIKPLGNCDTEFIDEFISEIIDQVEYFDHYTITKEMEAETEKMINEGSWAYEFINDAKSKGLFNFDRIPTNHMSKFVKCYLTENNESMMMPSSKTINKELEPLMKQLDYKLSPIDKLVNSDSFDKLEYNAQFIQEEIYNEFDYSSRTKTRYWYKEKPSITNKEQDDFLNTYINKDYKTLDTKEKIITKYYIDIGDMDIISWYEVTN